MGSRKTNNRLPKRNGAGQFSDLRGNLAKKRIGGGVSEGRGVMANVHYEYFLDNPAFRMVVILKSSNKVLKKQLQKNPTC